MPVTGREHEQRVAIDIGCVERRAFGSDLRKLSGIAHLGRIDQVVVGGRTSKHRNRECNCYGQPEFWDNFHGRFAPLNNEKKLSVVV